MIVRWLKFNAVGGIGMVVQLSALALLANGLRLNYLAATALAVEAAVMHNYIWHERFTWADRPQSGRIARFLRFNLSTGALSILSNVALMAVLAGRFRLPYVAANLIAIAVTSVANFVVNDRLVFAPDSGRVSNAPRLPALR